MTLPLVPHEFSIAVEETLANLFEGDVGSVSQILRMLDSSFRPLFLKFERFSSLRNSRCDLACRKHGPASPADGMRQDAADGVATMIVRHGGA
jgi:hypothetical protein